MPSSPEALATFAAWLPSHAGLVGKLIAYLSAPAGVDKFNDFTAVKGQLLAFSLQQAAAAKTPLHLQSLTTDLTTPAIFAALPSPYLTSLQLSCKSDSTQNVSTGAFKSAIGSLTNLQSLSLESFCISVASSCLAALAPLTHLTNLNVRAKGWDTLQHLPPQLQLLSCDSCGEAVKVDIGHVTGLTKLVLFTNALQEGTSLPANLAELQTSSCNLPPALATQAASLQHLSMRNIDQKEPKLMEALAALPQLLHVGLHYVDIGAAAAAAPGWGQLPQLQSLELVFPSDPVTEVEAIGAGLAAATNLTRLDLRTTGLIYHLPSLQQLRQLSLTDLEGCSRKQMQHIAALPRLTCLEVVGCHAFDDAVAVEVTSKLTGLQRLVVSDTGMVTDAVLPVLVHLRSLRYLNLVTDQGFAMQSLQYLKQLTQLESLLVFFYDDDSDSGIFEVDLRRALGSRCRLVVEG